MDDEVVVDIPELSVEEIENRVDGGASSDVIEYSTIIEQDAVNCN